MWEAALSALCAALCCCERLAHQHACTCPAWWRVLPHSKAHQCGLHPALPPCLPHVCCCYCPIAAPAHRDEPHQGQCRMVGCVVRQPRQHQHTGQCIRHVDQQQDAAGDQESSFPAQHAGLGHHPRCLLIGLPGLAGGVLDDCQRSTQQQAHRRCPGVHPAWRQRAQPALAYDWVRAQRPTPGCCHAGCQGWNSACVIRTTR